MRGTRETPSAPFGRPRIIPAHAGNSETSSRPNPAGSDHPRACGELGSDTHDTHAHSGSSPRMRGTRRHVSEQVRINRIILAHAGNSLDLDRAFPHDLDHPRACGELVWRAFRRFLQGGSSPRMRGTHAPPCVDSLGPRIIPAHAGNSGSSLAPPRMRSDHPRACGELATIPALALFICGSSPRMRGTPADDVGARSVHRIIPAHAGNSRTTSRTNATLTDHPRACGELMSAWISFSSGSGSSPRMRGTPIFRDPSIVGSRIIPAHAGNSAPLVNPRVCQPDHPRACGELSFVSRSVSRHVGSSPRMRGTLLLVA